MRPVPIITWKTLTLRYLMLLPAYILSAGLIDTFCNSISKLRQKHPTEDYQAINIAQDDSAAATARLLNNPPNNKGHIHRSQFSCHPPRLAPALFGKFGVRCSNDP